MIYTDTHHTTIQAVLIEAELRAMALRRNRKLAESAEQVASAFASAGLMAQARANREAAAEFRANADKLESA
jgi:hypothetical protein